MEVEEVVDQPAALPEQACEAQGPRALCLASATVPMSTQDMEAPVLGQQQWEAVHARHAQGEKNLLDFFMDPTSQSLDPPQIPGRFSAGVEP